MTGRTAAEIFPPGEYIREELEARGWTQGDLADIMGRPVQAVSEIVSAKKSITPETARGLGAAFGTGPEIWLNLESTYRLSLARRSDVSDVDVSRRAKVYEKGPIKQMIKRRWIKPYDNIEDMEEEIVRFFELTSINDVPNLSAAARKSVTYDEQTPSEMAWCFRAKQLAATLDAATYDKRKLKEGLPRLRSLAASEKDIEKLPKLLADLGIRFVVVEHLPRTHIDGAAFWLDEESPAIAMSLRHDRIDGFWFTLAHELWHIKNGDRWILDNNLVGQNCQKTVDKPKSEQKADRMASEFFVPRGKLESFIARVRPLFSKKRIVLFARSIGVHPGIVIGQLQYRDEIKYSHSREMLVKVRDTVTSAALTDGWGHFPMVR